MSGNVAVVDTRRDTPPVTGSARTERLSGLDAGFLYMETPALHMHTLKVALLDPPPGGPLSFEAMKAEIGTRLPLLEPLCRRLLDVPLGFHHPVWFPDPDLDIDHHVQRVMLPGPGTRRQLDELIGDLAGVPLDRRRPLWQLYVIEGLADGRLAILVKVHHAVADGSAASALLTTVMSTDRDESAPPSPRAQTSGVVPSRRELLIDALRDHIAQLTKLPWLIVHTLAGGWSLVAHRRRSTVTTPVPMVSTPRTTFNAALTPTRSFATTSLALSDAREVKARFQTTLNDVVLAMVGGALRSYLLDADALPDRPLVAGVPVATGGGDEVRVGGNRVSTLFTTLATDVADPVARLRSVHEVTAEAKVVQSLMGTDTFGAWVQYTPPRPYAWIVRQYSAHHLADRHPPPINLVVSNVPGPGESLRVAGARLAELYSVGPILEGIGLNVTVWTYVDRLYVGVLACRDTLPDVSRIADAMEPALAELVVSARQQPVIPSRA
jgi:diacylglycerol O-acyltransferase / wax synthase